jgi:hypothetical protein
MGHASFIFEQMPDLAPNSLIARINELLAILVQDGRSYVHAKTVSFADGRGT